VSRGGKFVVEDDDFTIFLLSLSPSTDKNILACNPNIMHWKIAARTC
jgi:hypothetical protein